MIHPFTKKQVRPAHQQPISRPYKIMHVASKQQPTNDENSNCLNLPSKVTSLSKKIKRSPEASASAGRTVRQVHFRDRARPEVRSFECYMQTDLQMGPLASMLIPHRMDNDCESDVEQVEAGIKKLTQSLKDRIANGEPTN